MKHRLPIMLWLMTCLLGLITCVAFAETEQSPKQMLSPSSQMCLKLTEAGTFQEALAACQDALREAQLRHGIQHPRTCEPLANLARLQFQRGEYQLAEKLYREAIESLITVAVKYQFRMVMLKTSLAATLDIQGKYQQVEEAYQQAIGILAKDDSSQASVRASVLNNLAEFYRSQAKYDRAEATLQEALAVLKKAGLIEDRWYAHVLNSLGELHRELGRFAYAEEFLRTSLELRTKILRAQDPDIATTLNNYAELQRERGRYAEALPMYERAISIRRQSLGDRHPHYASTIENIGKLYLDSGNAERAELFLKEALNLREKSVGTQSYLYAKTLYSMAQFHRIQGHWSVAREMLLQALAVRVKIFGENHILVGQVEHELALVAFGQGDERTALVHLQRALEIEEGILELADGETRLLALMDKYQALAMHVYSLLFSKAPTARQLAIRLLLLRKGRWLEAGLRANSTTQTNNTVANTNEVMERLHSLRGQLVLRLLGKHTNTGSRDDNSIISSMQTEIDELERKLVAASGQSRRPLVQSLNTILDQVTSRLSSGEALIEFVRLSPYRFMAPGMAESLRWSPPRYVAIVISPNNAPLVYDLGVAGKIEDAVSVFMSAIYNRRSSPMALANGVYEMIISKMKKYFMKFKKIYISTDGVLNTLPFYALHDGQSYLIDKFEFVYLTSGRDLARGFDTISKSRLGTALLFADPAYGDISVGQSVATTEGSSMAPLAYRSKDLLGMAQSLVALPGSRAEVDSIAKYLPSSRVLTGTDASESNLRRAESPWLLHLALHAGAGHPSSREASRLAQPAATSPTDPMDPKEAAQTSRGLAQAIGPVRSETPSMEQTMVESPQQLMTRSALFLSGAASAGSISDAGSDGILTAEEARNLHLHGTALVVLSACESGLGVLHASHGVFGLRRAFLVAGAESLVTSLWRIDDNATVGLMKEFYRQLLTVKRERSSSLRMAMQAQRAKYPHPYYWAPFILIGRSDALRFDP